MSISIDYNAKENVIYAEAEGVIRLDDAITYYETVASLDLKPNYRVLGDFSNANLEINGEEVQSLAQKRKAMTKAKEKIKISFFCRKDSVFGLGRMYEALLGEDNYEVMVFRSEKKAREWLGL